MNGNNAPSPCRICGERDMYIQFDQGKGWCIECTHSKVQGSCLSSENLSTSYYNDPTVALESWNQMNRSKEDQLMELFKISNVEDMVIDDMIDNWLEVKKIMENN